jgi:peptidoglycan LD-endopeptidase LytH
MKLGAKPVNPLLTLPGIILFVILAAVLVGGYFVFRWWQTAGSRTSLLLEYLNNPAAHPDWIRRANSRCPGAPFAFPTDGSVGYLWGDSFRPLTRHSGIDIFDGKDPGQTPVYSASDGFLTRLADWKSAVIVRVPSDPLQPGREIWVYYTHMANSAGISYIDPTFPPGVREAPVRAGQPLGFQGNYSGDPGSPTGVHLHLSIVLGDGRGGFRNETDIGNTLDPSPYFGLNLSAAGKENRGIGCSTLIE